LQKLSLAHLLLVFASQQVPYFPPPSHQNSLLALHSLSQQLSPLNQPPH
jgi:hypothetical protein